MKKLDKLPLPSVDAKIYGIEVKQMQESDIWFWSARLVICYNVDFIKRKFPAVSIFALS